MIRKTSLWSTSLFFVVHMLGSCSMVIAKSEEALLNEITDEIMHTRGMGLHTNIAAINAQRSLASTQAGLDRSIQRLASGLRINTAQDDAAGLAISERMTTQIRGLIQAERNAQDGISLAQTAEASLGHMAENIQRVRELAIQSANATNSPSDRAALQREVSQLVSEFNRVRDAAQFNGINLFSTAASFAFQVGPNAAQTITVNNSKLDYLLKDTPADVHFNWLVDTLYDNKITFHQETRLTFTGIAYLQCKVPPGPNGTGTLEILASKVVDGLAINGVKPGTTYLLLNIDDVLRVPAGIELTMRSAGCPLKLFIDSAAANPYYTVTMNNGGMLKMKNRQVFQFAPPAVSADGKSTDFGWDKMEFTSTVSSLKAVTALTVSAFDGKELAYTYAAGGMIDFATGYSGIEIDTESSKVEFVDALRKDHIFRLYRLGYHFNVGDFYTSTASIANADYVLGQLAALRSDYGAVQNRLEATVANIRGAVESLSAARSRIRDANYAVESTELSKNKALQQAGTAMLVQANSLSDSMLSLIK